MRAKWGLWYCCKRMKEYGVDDETNEELLQGATKKLKQDYQEKDATVPGLLDQ